ncbi:RluA family pseudouridine synthase [Gammaproteobacteria bacterium]|jgi:23S rRNA pseudouridine955/2504/2580 synthase|nr:RluA family pseudouridine synthase [Gammaproteobacteria bacterium]|tara:strand:- start:149 stop:1066 length:918 start_codon:yes stop_codon:yes gene_type:complete
MEDNFHPVSSYTVTSEYQGVRLDNCLIARLKGLPRTKIYSIIRKGEVRVNSSRSAPSLKLKIGDLIRIPPYRTSTIEKVFTSNSLKEKIINSIISAEKEFIIMNKPVGIACHGGSGISSGVIEIIRDVDPKYKDAQLAHRIDRDTSGCLVIALKKSFLRKLHQEIRNKQVDKYYDLVVFGSWPEELKSVNKPISKSKSKSGEREAIIDSGGKESLTEFHIIQSNNNYSLLKAKIITGRMHQIRAHTQFEGYPIVGDKKYGDEILNERARKKGLNRMLLHANSIKFKNLGIECSTDTPKIFNSILS